MANNTYVNKVEYGENTLIDLTSDDVTAADVLSGVSFHLPSGAPGTGTIVTKTASDLSASGKTVTVPAGYYASQATKDVATASPSFDGGALNNKAATAVFTNMTTSSTDTSGVAIQAAGAAGRDAVLYNGAVNGWVIASDNASASAAVSTENWTGTTYYATGVTLGNGKTFDITVPNGVNATVTFRFTVDANGNTTVTSVES